MGPRGFTGPAGPKGDDGPAGIQGPKGDAATITVGNTTTVSPGTDANVYNSGTTNDAVLQFSIPQGDTGATGQQGPQGEPGRAEVGTTPPSGPTEGDLWFDSSSGVTYVYYEDINSSQWVSTSNNNSVAVAGYGSVPPSSPPLGNYFSTQTIQS